MKKKNDTQLQTPTIDLQANESGQTHTQYGRGELGANHLHYMNLEQLCNSTS